ncbi:DNA polymerase V [Catalinimonas alkaloidigena]|uniref:DNA polymerase V n=2 Tax=Catalinimonas alkaloidigena TaxID=1075417 RepID=A0A1G9U4K9_9BACT|nr:DNA polymerase V [Catalinimonas alkaloidigena]
MPPSSERLTFIRTTQEVALQLPLYACGVSAGFPSPADDHLENLIDLNRFLIRNAPATFLARVKGNSMRDCNIHEGDILVIDRSITPREGHLVLCVVDGEFTCKWARGEGKQLRLISTTEDVSTLPLYHAHEVTLWGVVTYTIHRNA